MALKIYGVARSRAFRTLWMAAGRPAFRNQASASATCLRQTRRMALGGGSDFFK